MYVKNTLCFDIILNKGTNMNNEQYNIFLQESLQNIRKAENENFLTIFAGAGVSVASGAPTADGLEKNIRKRLNKLEEVNEEDLLKLIENSFNQYIKSTTENPTNISIFDNIREKLKKFNKTKETDLLKLAEIFYNQYGENIYYEALMELIPVKLKANEIHRKIVNLNLRNLITTNWDSMFEESIADEGIFFDTIACDKDMGCGSGFAKFIKMHGDFNNKNIVLKESDYLLYDEKFPLIHNYIKSIFSTNVVVMLGYSLSDYNVRQIISWVNFKAANIKPIYFIKTGCKFDYQEFEYYKNKNIFILYHTNISSNANTLFNEEKSKQLYSFLELIKNKENNFAETIKELIGIFDDYKYILPNEFVNIMRNAFGLYKSKEICYDQQNNEIVINSDKIDINNFKEFTKEAIKVLNGTRLKICKTSESKGEYKAIHNHLFAFDYKALENEITKISFDDNMSDEKELRKAFLLYQNGQFEEYYSTLKKVSKNAFKNKNYKVWFISEFNKTKCVFNYTDSKERDQLIESYLEEARKIDLQESILKIPKSHRIVLSPLVNLDAALNKMLIDIKNVEMKILNDYFLYEKGGSSLNNEIEITLTLLYQIDALINSYSLTIEFSNTIKEVYKSAVSTLLVYFGIGLIYLKNKEKYQNNLYLMHPSINFIKDDNIDLVNNNFLGNLIYLRAIRYFKSNELKNILNRYFGNNMFLIDNLDNNNKNIILQIFDNIIDRLDGKIAFNNDTEFLNNFLIMSSKIKVCKDTFKGIIDRFNEMLRGGILTLNEYESMNMFIVNQYNLNKENIDVENLKDTIYSWIELFMCGKLSFYNFSAPDNSQLFTKMFSILINQDKKFDNIHKIKNFISSLKQYHIEEQILITSSFLIRFYPISTEDIQKLIIEYSKELLDANTKISRYTLELKFILFANSIMPELKEELINNINTIKRDYNQDIVLLSTAEHLERLLYKK